MRIAVRAISVVAVWLTGGAPLEGQSTLPPSARAVAQRVAAHYPLTGAVRYGRDSIVLVFRDTSLTEDALHAKAWMFGPPTTKAEEDGCPPEKVLGRRIARAVWAQLGRPMLRERVVVRVANHYATEPGLPPDEVNEDMYYYPIQLSGSWVGDSLAMAKQRRASKSRPDGKIL